MDSLLSELQEKEVISMKSGLNLGRITDAKIDSNGKVSYFIVNSKKVFRSLRNDEITFTFSEIEKIGEDVILVRV